jgi:hypothetical protein
VFPTLRSACNESDYGLGRWGAKFSFVRGKMLAQIAYLANPTGFSSFGDAYEFARTSNTSFQWKIAYADPAKPYELGIFGETGALGFTGSGLLPGLQIDNYTSNIRPQPTAIQDS